MEVVRINNLDIRDSEFLRKTDSAVDLDLRDALGQFLINPIVAVFAQFREDTVRF